MISVDVQEGTSVVFDSYPKDKDGNSRMSQYKSENQEGEEGDDKSKGVQKTIRYNEGIESKHIIASASVPINYDYTTLEAEIGSETATTAVGEVDKNNKNNSIENNRNINNNNNNNKTTRYFWDGGLLSNTPLRELIHEHREYWLNIQKSEFVPDLDLYIVDVHPSRNDNISLDRDGVINRNIDVAYHNRNLYDIKVANIVSDYIDLANALIDFAKENGIKEEDIKKKVLNRLTNKSKSHLEIQDNLKIF